MTKKFLGRVVAGAALGGASLLAWAPAAASADVGHDPGDAWRHRGGEVFSSPRTVRPGQQVKIIEICHEPQAHPWAWSELTGRLDLRPAPHRPDGHPQVGSRPDGTSPGDAIWPEDRTPPDGGGWPGDGSRPEDRTPPDGGGWPGDGSRPEDRTPPDGGGWPGDGSRPGPGGSLPTFPTQPPLDGQNPPPQQPPLGGASPTALPMPEPPQDVEPIPGPGATQPAPAGQAPGGRAGGMTVDGGWAVDTEAPAARPEHSAGGYVYSTVVEIPGHTKPGHYRLDGPCGHGNLVVLPSGWVDGGGGPATGESDQLTAGGTAMLGAATLAGLVLMRRRRTDASPC